MRMSQLSLICFLCCMLLLLIFTACNQTGVLDYCPPGQYTCVCLDEEQCYEDLVCRDGHCQRADHPADGDPSEIDGDSDDEASELDIGEMDEDSPESEPEMEAVPDELAIAAIRAPGRYSVEVIFNRDPGEAFMKAENISIVHADADELSVLAVDYRLEDAKLKITTKKQKLGLEYVFSIVVGAGEGESDGDADGEAEGETNAIELTAPFLAADTAEFYAVDFADPEFGNYVTTAQRAAVGEYCVLYIEDGMAADDVAQTVADFDSKIYPMQTDLFIEAPDIDENGKIVILGLDGDNYYGGYFSPVNAYSDEQTMAWWGIHSNEMEMLYINLIDRSFYIREVIPHEFQHLLYHEGHGFGESYWDYHDEGLAECAKRVVYGENENATLMYQWDPNGAIALGRSMVNWAWAEYENYALAYLFWSYLASQLDGVETYADIYDLPSGSPEEVDQFIFDKLGTDFPTMHMNSLIATLVQAEQGPYGFEGFISFDDHTVPTVPEGTNSVDIEAFTGAFFRLNEEQLDYPGTQGAHIRYAGIDAEGNVDLEAPFTLGSHYLMVYHSSMDYQGWPKEHSGPDVASLGKRNTKSGMAAQRSALPVSKLLDPPPFNPERIEALKAWQRAVGIRSAAQ